jgi:hypothetical protein
MRYGVDMTITTDTYVSVIITNDGIEVHKNNDDEPGAYRGVNSPGWLNGEPNHFVGYSLADAKERAMIHMADMIEEIQATFEELEGLGR